MFPTRRFGERQGGVFVAPWWRVPTHLPPLHPPFHPPPPLCSVHDMMGMAEHITPHRVRHICVTYVMQRPEVFGNAHEDFAGVMGHALRMWTEVYDEAVNNKSMAAAARALERLRGELRTLMTAVYVQPPCIMLNCMVPLVCPSMRVGVGQLSG